MFVLQLGFILTLYSQLTPGVVSSDGIQTKAVNQTSNYFLSKPFKTPDASQNYSIDEWHSFLLDLYQDIKLWRDIYIFFGSLFTGAGLTLNTLCIIIFVKSKLFRNSSFPYYVYILALVDTLNIFFRFLFPQLIEAYVRLVLVKSYHVGPNEIDMEKYDIYTANIVSEYHCSIFLYLYNSFTLISVWLMAAVSFERLVVTKIAIQTKHMIKLRAFIILILIFTIIFLLNVFDLAPGLYIKPQWYANLTLLCERDDIEIFNVYKQMGPITFNTETFVFVRTCLQTVVPFLLVLIFNVLIIYNFKKIKATAMSHARITSPCLSYNSSNF